MKWETNLPSPGPSLYSSGSVWTLQQNKTFENALAIYDKDTPDRWEKVAAMLPGKNAIEVRKHYEDLVEDVSVIEAGLVAIPSYSSSSYTLEWIADKSDELHGLKQSFGNGVKGSSAKSSEQERKKGVPWTQEEHRHGIGSSLLSDCFPNKVGMVSSLFLMGLSKYGKGDWRSISRNFVITRTPTQVASHAQKYFIRLSSGNKDKRRSSIHDITSVNSPDRRQLPLQHASAISVQTSSTPTSISQPPGLMYPSPVGRVPVINCMGSPADNHPLMLPSYSVGLYAQRGLGGHSPRNIFPDSSLGVAQMGYSIQHAMLH
eukprot:Gb_28483 [translate_table: standard]